MKASVNQDTRAQLGQLIKVGGLGLAFVALVAIGVMLVLKFKIDNVVRSAAPAQISMTRLKGDLDMLMSLTFQMREANQAAALRELNQRIAEVLIRMDEYQKLEFIPDELKNSLGEIQPAIKGLETLAGQRGENSAKAQASIQVMHEAIESVKKSLDRATVLIDRIGSESQKKLVNARESSLQANRLIQQALTMREKLALFEASIQKIGQVEKRYKLSPIKERTGALIENMSSLDLKGMQLTDVFQKFKNLTETFLQSEKGLFALSLAAIKKEKNVNENPDFQGALKNLTDGISEISSTLNSRIDPLQLQVTKETKAMTEAVNQMASVQKLTQASATILVAIEQLATQSEVILGDKTYSGLGEHRISVSKKLASTQAQLVMQSRELEDLKGFFNAASSAKQEVQSAIASTKKLEQSLLSDQGALQILESVGVHRQEFEASLKQLTSLNNRAQNLVVGDLKTADDEQSKSASELMGLTRFTPPLLLILSLAVAFLGRKRGNQIVAAVLTAEDERRNLMASQQQLFATLLQRTAELKDEISGLQTLSNTLDDQAQRTQTEAQGSLADARMVSNTSRETVQRMDALSSDALSISASVANASQRMQLAVASCASARDQVDHLNAASGKVGSILHFISGIAEQIHILSLNASIEAQRAGSAGRSFGVLAQEVRALAKKTTDSTVSIQSTILGVQDGISKVKLGIGEIDQLVIEVEQIQNQVAVAASSQQNTTFDVKTSVSRSADGSEKMSAAFEAVALAASGTSEVASRTRLAAQRLEALVEELTHLTHA